MSLRTKLALLVSVAVALSVSLASFAALRVSAAALHRGIDESLVEQAQRAERSFRALGNPRSRPSSRGGVPGLFAVDGVIIQVVGQDGQIVVALDDSQRLPVDRQAQQILGRSEADLRLQTVRLEGEQYRMVTLPIRSGGIQVGRSLREVESALSDITDRLVVVWLAGTGLAALLGWLIARQMVLPIVRLTGAAETIAETLRLDQAIEGGGTDEVGRLGRAFNQMLSALTLSQRQQQRLVQDASHELRTPLTSIRTNIDVLARRYPELSAHMVEEIVRDVHEESIELSDLVAELVAHASGDSETSPAVSASMVAVAHEVAARFQRRTGREILVVADSRAAGVKVLMQPDRIDRAVSNLVGNATKFSPRGAPIELHVTPTMVECRDGGPGIPPEDTERIFDRFYRPTESRSAPGSGLGLAIVKQVASAHGGTVWARNLSEGGAAIGFSVAESSEPPSRS